MEFTCDGGILRISSCVFDLPERSFEKPLLQDILSRPQFRRAGNSKMAEGHSSPSPLFTSETEAEGVQGIDFERNMRLLSTQSSSMRGTCNLRYAEIVESSEVFLCDRALRLQSDGHVLKRKQFHDSDDAVEKTVNARELPDVLVRAVEVSNRLRSNRFSHLNIFHFGRASSRRKRATDCVTTGRDSVLSGGNS